jgi:hypothetical protein
VKKLFKDDYGWWRPWTVVSSVVAVVLLLVVLLTASIGGVAYHVDQRSCSKWGDVAGRETRFERLAFLSWDCFTKMPDGTWLPKDSLRGNEDSR